MVERIRDELFRLQDTGYRDFQAKLMPTVNPDTIIGVRTPALRAYAKQLIKTDDVSEFLHNLPHRYFDENQLHAFIISELKDFDACLAEVNRFLPYVDNWATCDQLSPNVFKKHKPELLESIGGWIASNETYTMRFGIGMLLEHYLDEAFDPAYPKMVAAVKSDEYYINMMIAWYFAEALAKQWDAALPFIEGLKLDVWTHNKAIQKAIESRRIPEERKTYLRNLKIKKGR